MLRFWRNFSIRELRLLKFFFRFSIVSNGLEFIWQFNLNLFLYSAMLVWGNFFGLNFTQWFNCTHKLKCKLFYSWQLILWFISQLFYLFNKNLKKKIVCLYVLWSVKSIQLSLLGRKNSKKTFHYELKSNFYHLCSKQTFA